MIKEEEKAKDPMKYAYQEMFYGCVSMKDVPDLPVNKPNVKESDAISVKEEEE